MERPAFPATGGVLLLRSSCSAAALEQGACVGNSAKSSGGDPEDDPLETRLLYEGGLAVGGATGRAGRPRCSQQRPPTSPPIRDCCLRSSFSTYRRTQCAFFSSHLEQIRSLMPGLPDRCSTPTTVAKPVQTSMVLGLVLGMKSRKPVRRDTVACLGFTLPLGPTRQRSHEEPPEQNLWAEPWLPAGAVSLRYHLRKETRVHHFSHLQEPSVLAGCRRKPDQKRAEDHGGLAPARHPSRGPDWSER